MQRSEATGTAPSKLAQYAALFCGVFFRPLFGFGIGADGRLENAESAPAGKGVVVIIEGDVLRENISMIIVGVAPLAAPAVPVPSARQRRDDSSRERPRSPLGRVGRFDRTVRP